ncbi:putative HTH-type transcriptional regulator YdeL [Heyndrickxia sporothermodurans]|nr:putative HTH-type transcriptional regulator YdeL [Heyndrickxia sporothermodurans]
MYINLNRKSNQPLWQQIANEIIRRINKGTLVTGNQLVPSRLMAQELGVSRSTVQLAYDELISRGYAQTYRRGGTRIIATGETDISRKLEEKECLQLPININFEKASEQMEEWLSANSAHDNIQIDFRHHEPFVDEQFLKVWKQSYLKAMKDFDLKNWGYGSSFGLLDTRIQIQNYLELERGIEVKTDQILITGGTQQAIDLISQVFLKEEDIVAVEDPGYPGTRVAFMYRGMKITGVPVDHQGIVVNKIPSKARIISVTPSHQRPTGVVMSIQRRKELIEFALKNQSIILEDDFDGEYRYHGGPLPSLFAEAPSHVLYILTFSKVLSPSIRLAAIIGNSVFIDKLRKMQALIQRQLPIMEQLTLAEFLKQGDFTRHIRRMRNIYKRRHQIMIKTLNENGLNKMFRIQGTETGLHVFLEADRNFQENQVIVEAARQRIGVYPLKPYCYASQQKGLLLGFAWTNEDDINSGIYQLAKILKA